MKWAVFLDGVRCRQWGTLDTRDDAITAAFDPMIADRMTVEEFEELHGQHRNTAGWAAITNGRWVIKPVDE